ncbi:hypothetical protein FACS189490_05220 [Clostridia bacterium]|nr:hypothetical protein FACS189490_05220 [Clostridia bacterium]
MKKLRIILASAVLLTCTTFTSLTCFAKDDINDTTVQTESTTDNENSSSGFSFSSFFFGVFDDEGTE